MKRMSLPAALRDHHLWVVFGLAVLANVAAWVFLLLRLGDPEAFRSLAYNIYIGDSFFGPARSLFALPFLGGVFLLANLGLGIFVYRRMASYAYLLGSAALMLQLLTITPEIFIVLRNV